MRKRYIIVSLVMIISCNGCVNSKLSTPDCRYENAQQNLIKANTEKERFYALNDAAKESYIFGEYDEALSYAEELLSLSSKFSDDWNYGNAVQDSHVVLGKIALKDENLILAKEHLILAGKSPGSPQMDSFGPNMSLAKGLLLYGETEIVLEYFELCKSFWTLHNGKLDKWSDAVKKGRVPDFGANLIY